MNKKIPLPIAVASIVILMMVTTCLTFRLNFRPVKKSSVISCIVQTGPVKEALPTQYLAELLGLSSDCPTFFDDFNEKEAEEKLMLSSLIKSAKVEKIKPSTIYIDYTLYEPIARITDYENIVIDQTRHPFPFRPFFTPKELPEIYIGMKESVGAPERIGLALEVLDAMTKRFYLTRLKIKKIDVSRISEPSIGQREIIALVIDELYSGDKTFRFEYFLRLNIKEYEKNLVNFLALRRELIKSQEKYMADYLQNPYPSQTNVKTIDLRIDKMAYIDGG
jgi:cell division septal protein FtsQ